jgi:branched-chain amino acid transport system permease protein
LCGRKAFSAAVVRKGFDRLRTRNILIVVVIAILCAAACFALSRFAAFLVYTVVIAAIGALALNLLIGFCGQISFAQGALLGVGAYTAGNLGNAGFDVFSILGAGVAAAVISALIGLPAMRLRGLYFAIATLAAQAILEYLFKTLEPITKGVSGLTISPLKLFGTTVSTDQGYAALGIVILLLTWLFLTWLMRTNLGRAFLIVRESELVARGMGINVARTKMSAFVISGFIVGVTGALLGFTSRLANPEAFSLNLSVDYIAMIIVGGLGSWVGSIIGAAFVTLLPEAIQRVGESLHVANLLFALREMTFGLLIMIFLIFEPRGLAALGRRFRGLFSSSATTKTATTT